MCIFYSLILKIYYLYIWYINCIKLICNKTSYQRIFIFIGSVVGFLGTSIGTFLGIFISINIGKIQIFLEGMFDSKLFSAEVYFFNIIPSKIDYGEVTLIFFISIILSILSTIYPSWKASKIEPANVLRYEWNPKFKKYISIFLSR